MATVIEIPCPNCDKPLKVPESVFGKKIKCKHCSHPFVVPEPDAEEKPKPKKTAVAPSKPGGASVKAKKEKEEPKKEPAKKEEPKKEEPKPAASAYKFEDDDDEGAKPNPMGLVDEGPEVPRCPHCAKELDPPDAKVCLHCGFNNETRVKIQSKKVWEPDSSDWMNHLLPGILAALGSIAIIVIVAVCWSNMRGWMLDSFLEKEELGADGEKAFLVKPGAFITMIIAALILPFIACTRFAIKRLAIDNKPEEKEKKE